MAAGITNRCNLIAFRQPDFKSLNAQQQPGTSPAFMQTLVNLYEYTIITGNDFWDLIISTSPKFITTLIEQLELNFMNQLYSTKKAYFTRFYALIFALTRRG